MWSLQNIRSILHPKIYKSQVRPYKHSILKSHIWIYITLTLHRHFCTVFLYVLENLMTIEFTYTNTRKNFASLLDRGTKDREVPTSSQSQHEKVG